jgi:uncharacterized repeat protein (TIGR01451 family)
VTLSDALPGGLAWSVAGDSSPTCSISGSALSCNFGTIAAGASAKAHVTAPTNNDLCGTYTNPKADVTASNHDPVSSSSATVTVTGCVFPPRLGVVKTADAGTVAAGGTIGFRMTVSNTGTGPATGVTLSDALPSGAGISWSVAGDSSPTCSISGNTLSCNFGTLAAGASATAHVTSPTANNGCATYTNQVATVSATNHASVSSGSASVVVNGCVGFCSATQGGWGQKASGNNIGKLRDTYFATVYPSGLNVGTATRYIRLTSAAAVEAYLPAGETAGALTAIRTNPLTTEAGVFGGQVTALRLNVDFSNAGAGGWNPGLAGMVYTSGPASVNGMTVAQILAMAQSVLAGGALPAGFVNIGEFNVVINAINTANTPDGCAFGNGALRK